MIAFTSISPTHRNGDMQQQAIKSWISAGLKVYAFQTPKECEAMASDYPEVTFVPTVRTMHRLFKAPYVSINAMIDYAKEHNLEAVMLINSDIIFGGSVDRLKYLFSNCHKAIVIMKRLDFDTDMSQAKRYDGGMDAFIVHSTFYDIYPQSIYCMGQTWWDYWMQYIPYMAGKFVYHELSPMIYHKVHPVQYNQAEWERMTRYFQWENNYDLGERNKQTSVQKAGQVTSRIYDILQRAYHDSKNIL